MGIHNLAKDQEVTELRAQNAVLRRLFDHNKRTFKVLVISAFALGFALGWAVMWVVRNG